jgi:hypothetical protein
MSWQHLNLVSHNTEQTSKQNSVESFEGRRRE